MKTPLIFMLIAAASWPALVLAGPFGYEMGQAISGEPDGQAIGGLFRKESPKEFAGWEGVTAYYMPQTGVCSVIALKRVPDGDAFGIAHRLAADSLVETLTKKYGTFENNKVDFLMPGSIWNKPNDWLTGIRKRERYYGYQKVDDIEGNLALIQVIVLEHHVMLEYHFNNYDACKEAASEAALSDL